MPSFLKPIFLNPNISQKRFKEKIKVTKRDVSLQFLLASDLGSTYRSVHIVNINPAVRQQDPSKPLTPRNIDMDSLRDAIIANIDLYDRKYMILTVFDHRKAEFRLNVKKWFKDTTTGMAPKVHISKFDRSFRLKKLPPKMILFDSLRIGWSKFVVRKFREWLESQKKEAKFFKYLIPESLRSKIRTKIRNMFDWYYDFQWNTVVAKLKPMWIVALLYATGLVLRKMRRSDLKNRNKKELFAVKVKKNIQKFDRKKWKRFISKRFI